MRPVQKTTSGTQFDSWGIPRLFPSTLIRQEQLDEWCDRLARPLTDLIQTHRQVLAALNDEGEPELTHQWLRLLNEDTANRKAHGVHPDLDFYSISDVPPSLLKESQELVQIELRLILQARGKLDARRPGVLRAKSYHDFALRFIFNLWAKAMKERAKAGTNPTWEQAMGVAFWATVLNEFEELIFTPSFEDEEEVPYP